MVRPTVLKLRLAPVAGTGKTGGDLRASDGVGLSWKLVTLHFRRKVIPEQRQSQSGRAPLSVNMHFCVLSDGKDGLRRMMNRRQRIVERVGMQVGPYPNDSAE
jgi:hypothetical protein